MTEAVVGRRLPDSKIEELVVQRTAAIKAGRTDEAKRIRQLLNGYGIEITNTTDGVRWRRGSTETVVRR